MAFLNAATSSSQELACFTDIKVGKQMVKFKLDTDAEKWQLFPTLLINNC